MNSHPGFRAWAAVLFGVLVAVGVGTLAYQSGVAHGLALQAPTGTPPAMVVPYGWYRPWGFGFGFGPIFFVLLWILLARALFWGGRRRRWHYDGPDVVPPRFEEWHRRAHDRMNERPASPPTA
jgi:hypothetical protein